ncbi:hypothetical protein PgNI_10802 [Pyricularia grisea]|nr:hypothetical protein PgNI_10802 [Pyricularia grisea]TLD06891.1 hypothetical protein PgNI_10802 [Pyricularia grisea]
MIIHPPSQTNTRICIIISPRLVQVPDASDTPLAMLAPCLGRPY